MIYSDLNLSEAAVLSPRQFRVAAALCIASRGLAASGLARHGATVETLVVLERLGLIEPRACGALEPLYHLTDLGRSTVCAQHDDDDVSSASGDPAGPLPKEVTMTEVKSDPKPSAKKRAPRKAASTVEAVPPVEDVTDAPAAAAAPAVDFKPVFDAAVAKVVDVAGKDATTEAKKSYTRVSLGKSVAYVHYPSKKNVAVHVQQDDGTYRIVKLTDASQIDAELVPVITSRLEALAAKAAEKAAA